jgi:hypothetical protein
MGKIRDFFRRMEDRYVEKTQSFKDEVNRRGRVEADLLEITQKYKDSVLAGIHADALIEDGERNANEIRKEKNIMQREKYKLVTLVNDGKRVLKVAWEEMEIEKSARERLEGENKRLVERVDGLRERTGVKELVDRSRAHIWAKLRGKVYADFESTRGGDILVCSGGMLGSVLKYEPQHLIDRPIGKLLSDKDEESYVYALQRSIEDPTVFYFEYPAVFEKNGKGFAYGIFSSHLKRDGDKVIQKVSHVASNLTREEYKQALQRYSEIEGDTSHQVMNGILFSFDSPHEDEELGGVEGLNPDTP